MTVPVPSNNYSVGFGTSPSFVPYVTTTTPTSSNIAGPSGPFKLGQVWVNSSSAVAYLLTALSSSNGTVSATWEQLSTTTSALTAMGTSAAMSAGTITISTTAVTSSSIIFLTVNTVGGTVGTLSAPAASITAGTSFVINSSSNTDTSTVNWLVIN